MDYEKDTLELYIPTQEESELRASRYKLLDEMATEKTTPRPHFTTSETGELSWIGYIDYSERLLNGYTPSKSNLGKEEWQSNIVDNITRAKMRAIAAGVGLKIPEMSFEATNTKGLRSRARAEIMKQTVRHTFLDGNPALQTFLEVWQMLAHGVVFEYDGYLSGGAKRKVVDSIDLINGTVEMREEYVKVDGKPVSILIQPSDFFFCDFFRRDIQDQPYLAWVQRYTRKELETEFSKFKNFKYVRTSKELLVQSNQTMYSFDSWTKYTGKDDYAVFRFYSKEDDAYEIWVNGVPLLIAPLLWGGAKEKYYPFAKTIAEPFANTEFFVGMSFPGLMEAYQTTKGTIMNTIVDKLYRSLVKPMLVGIANKDLLEVEAELVDQDNRIYVPDVSQVKPMPFEGVVQGDLAVLALMDQAIERISIDQTQQGLTQKGVTARATLIADERARQLKGILFMFLEDLWLQKNKLRIRTILTHYLKDKSKRLSFKDKTISVPDVVFSDGARGVLDIHIADKKSQLLSVDEIVAREEAAQAQGITLKLISITKNYLDEWEYDFRVMSESLHNQDRLKKETDFRDKTQTEVTLFPEYFIANKEKRYEELLELYGESIAEMKPPAKPQAPPPEAQNTPLNQGANLISQANPTA